MEADGDIRDRRDAPQARSRRSSRRRRSWRTSAVRGSSSSRSARTVIVIAKTGMKTAARRMFRVVRRGSRVTSCSLELRTNSEVEEIPEHEDRTESGHEERDVQIRLFPCRTADRAATASACVQWNRSWRFAQQRERKERQQWREPGEEFDHPSDGDAPDRARDVLERDQEDGPRRRCWSRRGRG